VAVASLAFARPGAAVQDSPPALDRVAVEEHLMEQISGDLTFRDSRGDVVRLADYFDDGRPLVLVLAYYRCRMLCGLVLPQLAERLDAIRRNPGQDYRVLTVSIDPREGPEDASRKRAAVLHHFSQALPEDAWRFTVGSEANIRTLAAQVGFSYRYDASTDQFAHPSVIFVLTPEGKVSGYLDGLGYEAADLESAIDEAAAGRSGSSLTAFVLNCFHFNPALRRYGGAIAAFLRGGAALILVGVLGGVGYLWRRERRKAVA
jgi:protein SCO1/2